MFTGEVTELEQMRQIVRRSLSPLTHQSEDDED